METERHRLLEVVALLEEVVDHISVSSERESTRARPIDLIRRIERAMRGLQLTSVVPLAEQMRTALETTSQKLDRRVRFVARGHEIEIPRELRDCLHDSMVHAVLNAVVHGIESPEERFRKKKNSEGVVSFNATLSFGQLRLTVADDGRGPDYIKIIEKAKTLGIVPDGSRRGDRPDAEWTQFLFRPGFTTKSDADQMGGRGMGLAAIEAAVKREGGSARATAGVPEGFSLEIRFPVRALGMLARPVRLGGATCWLPADASQVAPEVPFPSARLGEVALFRSFFPPVAPGSPDGGGSRSTQIVRISSHSGRAIWLPVDSVGEPEFKVFRRMDPSWGQFTQSGMTKWWSRWFEMVDHAAFAASGGSARGVSLPEILLESDGLLRWLDRAKAQAIAPTVSAHSLQTPR